MKKYWDNNYIDKEYEQLNKPRIKTVEEWKIILNHEIKNNKGFDFIYKVLVPMYYEFNKTIFVGEFENKTGIKGLNLRVGEFRDRIRKIKEIDFDEDIREDSGTDRAWNIPFYSNEAKNIEKEHFSWVLRNELAQAMEELSIVENTNDILEDELLKATVNKSIIKHSRSIKTENDLELRKKPIINEKGVKVYRRDRQKAVNAFINSNFKCEIDDRHKSFLRKSDGLPYMEAHHLIPMSKQEFFEYSLDIEENIVTLCSHCHNEIHYGEQAETLIRQLFNERRELLCQKRIVISIDALLGYYGIKNNGKI